MSNELVVSALARPSTALTPAQLADMSVSSDHAGPVSIEGLARGKVRSTDLVAHFAVFKIGSRLDRVPINEDLYSVLRAMFDGMKEKHRDVIMEWVHR